MVCRCSSHAEHDSRASSRAASDLRYAKERKDKEMAELKAEIAALTPNIHKYEILEAAPVDKHLVMRVKYPSCTKCEYEGEKVIVFLNTSAVDALKWKTIDPHFRLPKDDATCAPPPAARFPATKDGWCDALEFARSKNRP